MESSRSFALGDIHGCFTTCKTLLEDVIQLTLNDTLYILGDYIDRGNDSKKVIDYLLDLKEAGYSLCFLRGNHEQMLLNSLNNKKKEQQWLAHGGKETLASFGVASAQELDEKYIQFFNELAYYVEYKEYILVHAGLNFKIKDPFKDTHAMLWLKFMEIDRSKINNKIIIHGHTPYPTSIILSQNPKIEADISVDGGCVFANKKEDLGSLIAFEMNTQTFYHQPFIG
ncbi:MAG: metallophosphoesterase family protein [Cyclobacteriaceae bacterium]